MKSFKYRIVFRSESGELLSFYVHAACVGNAVAVAWGKLESMVANISDYVVVGRFTV